MHTPDDPTPTAKRRQTCTHPRTINAIKTCSAAIQGPWTHLMITNQMQKALYTEKMGFYWKFWENKWVFNCDLNEECVCVADGERQIIPGYRTLIGDRSLA